MTCAAHFLAGSVGFGAVGLSLLPLALRAAVLGTRAEAAAAWLAGTTSLAVAAVFAGPCL